MGKEKNSIGLALGGGAVLGASHIGTLEAMEERSLAPTMISGTSIGALIAAFYAFGVSTTRMKEIAIEMNWLDISSLSISKLGLLSNKKLGNIIEEEIGRPNVEDSDLPLGIVTTDLSSGEKVVFLEGDLITAVMASSCIPGIFIPIENDGRMLVDGVLVENVPVSPLETMGADFIVAADVNALRLYKKPDDIIEVVMNAMDIAVDSLSIPKSDNVDLLIRPELSSYSRTDTDSKKITELIERGYQATIEKLDSSEGFVNQR